MRFHSLKRLSYTLAASAAVSITAAHAATPKGVWIDHTGRGGVEIKDCGDGKLCGHVVWLKDKSDSKGCGLQIIGNAKPIGGGQWDQGWIYSPEKKQRFSVELTPIDNDRLRVMGYKGIKLLSRTMVWHRASDSLERCDQTEAANTKAAPKTKTAVKTDAQPEEATTTKTTKSPRILNTPRSEQAKSSDNVRDAQADQTAKAPPVDRSGVPSFEADSDRPRSRNSDRQDDDIYATPPRQADRDRDDRQDNNDRSIDGLASLLEGFTKGDGIEVGDGYGMKVEKGPDGEKNCRLDVPFVTVKFPCED